MASYNVVVQAKWLSFLSFRTVPSVKGTQHARLPARSVPHAEAWPTPPSEESRPGKLCVRSWASCCVPPPQHPCRLALLHLLANKAKAPPVNEGHFHRAFSCSFQKSDPVTSVRLSTLLIPSSVPHSKQQDSNSLQFSRYAHIQALLCVQYTLVG